MNENIDLDFVAQSLGIDRATLPETLRSDYVSSQGSVEDLTPMSDETWAIVQAAIPALPVPKPTIDFDDRTFVEAARWHNQARSKGWGWSRMPAIYGRESSRRHRWARWAMLGYWRVLSDAIVDERKVEMSIRNQLSSIADAADTYRLQIQLRRGD